MCDMKDRAVLLERLMTAQGELRRRFIDASSPSLQAELAEVGGTTIHQMEVVRRLLSGDVMSMREVAESQGIGLSGATQLSATRCPNRARKGSRHPLQSGDAQSIDGSVHEPD
jgi:hypothetical protein